MLILENLRLKAGLVTVGKVTKTVLSLGDMLLEEPSFVDFFMFLRFCTPKHIL